MARQRKGKSKATEPEGITLHHPDRDGPRVGGKTFFEIAQERQLMQQADSKMASNKGERAADSDSEGEDDEDDNSPPTISPRAERILEASLWTVSLAMLHFTFDVLVQHQYGTEVNWVQITQRTIQAWASTFNCASRILSSIPLISAVFLFLFYPLHPHESNPEALPFLPLRYQKPVRETIFFFMSVCSGCYLIYVTNSKGYLATQKRAPPLGCLWLWAVIELDLLWATLSLVFAAAYAYVYGYGVK